MTRINCGIKVEKLTNKHLLAEHREIKRIPNCLHKSNLENIPEKFCLGPGHVKFFYDKGLYTFNRYVELYNECIKRNFNVTDFRNAWDIYKQRLDLYNDYTPTNEDIKIITQRINEKLTNKN